MKMKIFYSGSESPIFIITIQTQKQLLLCAWNSAWIKNADICKGAERKSPGHIAVSRLDNNVSSQCDTIWKMNNSFANTKNLEIIDVKLLQVIYHKHMQ